LCGLLLVLELKIVSGTFQAPSTASQTSLSKNYFFTKLSPLTIASTIGLAIGIPLDALVLGILCFLFWRENRRSKKQKISRNGIIVDPDKRAYFRARSSTTTTR